MQRMKEEEKIKALQNKFVKSNHNKAQCHPIA
jgi:hypothetical protein